MSKSGIKVIRMSTMERTGGRKYGIRNRTVDEEMGINRDLGTYEELSHKTKTLNLRIERNISADPLPDYLLGK